MEPTIKLNKNTASMAAAVLAAHCAGAGETVVMDTRMEQDELRAKVRAAWHIPEDRGGLETIVHGEVDGPWYRIVKLTYQAEARPLNRITANLYLPKNVQKPVPGMLMCMGHNGSKSSPGAQYGGQLIAYLGGACLVFDTIGEEERHVEGRLRAQGHDMYDKPEWREGSPDNRKAASDYQLNVMKRPVTGKLVLDAVRGLDLLASRPEVDPRRLGVWGSSLGGETAFWTAAMDTRVKAAVASSYAPELVMPDEKLLFQYMACRQSGLRAALDIEPRMERLVSLAAPHARVMFVTGEDERWLNLFRVRRLLGRAQPIAGDSLAWIKTPGGHWPFHLHSMSLAFLDEHLNFPNATRETIEAMPTVEFGAWGDRNIPPDAFPQMRVSNLLRGLHVPDIRAKWRPRADLACLGTGPAGPDYTFIGWRERCLELAVVE